MGSGKRRTLSSSEKVAILKQHFLEKKKVSDLCDLYGIHPTVFYRWQKEFFENAVSAFDKSADIQVKHLQRKVSDLEAKLCRKNEVLSELMEEHVSLKKNLGEN